MKLNADYDTNCEDFEEAIAQTCIELVNEVTGGDFFLEEPLSN